MKTLLTIAGVVVAAAALVGAGFFAGSKIAQAQIPALAVAPADPVFGPGSGSAYGFGRGELRGPGQMMGGMGWMMQYRDEIDTAIAKGLGMSIGDLRQALQSGKTLGQIAQEKGLTTDQLSSVVLNAYNNALTQAVKDGRLSQSQADVILEYLKQHMSQGLELRPGPMW